MGKHHERHPDDFYRTPAQCTRALLARESFYDWVHEPACGDGAISEVLREGHSVFSTDLVDRGYGRGGVDFLQLTRRCGQDLITNPPFNLADEFVLHAHELGYEKMAFLLRLSWLEGERRRKLVFSKHPPVRVHVFSARQTLWKGDDPNARATGGMAAYAWFVFANGFLGKPTIDWISRRESLPKLETA